VISVASVDANLQRSVFSQYNNLVDIAAPGSTILSTFPNNETNAAIIKTPTGAYSASTMIGSSAPSSGGLVGSIVFCRGYGKNVCDGPGGHICLIQRGETSFEVKAANCEVSGGIAAIIYNNIPNITLVGSLTVNSTSQINIPVLGMSAEDATSLYVASYGQQVSIQAMAGYAMMDGTSMSTPFVTGALAEIWRHCPLCSSDAVESCLLSSALPLKDNAYNYGFLQTR
jgi:serine protease